MKILFFFKFYFLQAVSRVPQFCALLDKYLLNEFFFFIKNSFVKLLNLIKKYFLLQQKFNFHIFSVEFLTRKPYIHRMFTVKQIIRRFYKFTDCLFKNKNKRCLPTYMRKYLRLSKLDLYIDKLFKLVQMRIKYRIKNVF